MFMKRTRQAHIAIEQEPDRIINFGRLKCVPSLCFQDDRDLFQIIIKHSISITYIKQAYFYNCKLRHNKVNTITKSKRPGCLNPVNICSSSSVPEVKR
ncbi:hypothetical protein PDJAM_G00014980 [Pangasius djambal]|uniref:Uncharacterized protein n=1 Tax=Pangasius djambal TaxID=1691987 RepID=A0ACC5YM47_9TELE|nr:hypothetical protein [Pangasius djambal]